MGNIRFISKLFKLLLMTARIVHECMKKLLAAGSPLALEKLVKPLHIAGPALKAEDQGLSEYTSPLKEMVEKKKVLFKLRFLMQNIFEKANNLHHLGLESVFFSFLTKT